MTDLRERLALAMGYKPCTSDRDKHFAAHGFDWVMPDDSGYCTSEAFPDPADPALMLQLLEEMDAEGWNYKILHEPLPTKIGRRRVRGISLQMWRVNPDNEMRDQVISREAATLPIAVAEAYIAWKEKEQ